MKCLGTLLGVLGDLKRVNFYGINFCGGLRINGVKGVFSLRLVCWGYKVRKVTYMSVVGSLKVCVCI